MLDKELKNLWRSTENNIQIEAERLVQLHQLDKKIGNFERKLEWRNYREYVALLLLIGSCIFFLRIPQIYLLAKFAALSVIIACVYIFIKIRNNARKRKDISPALPICDELKALHSYFLSEKNLLQSVLRWYILPFLPGFVLLEISQWPILNYSYIFSMVFLGIIIYWINLREAKKKFDPLLKQLENEIKAWEEK